MATIANTAHITDFLSFFIILTVLEGYVKRLSSTGGQPVSCSLIGQNNVDESRNVGDIQFSVTVQVKRFIHIAT